MYSRPILIGTRGSALALAQANEIKDMLRRAFPRLAFEIKTIKTTGDKMQNISLATKKTASAKANSAYAPTTIDKGLFTKEIEQALLRREADIAVHSLKDLPVTLPGGLTLAATPKRADVRDALIYRSADAPPSKETRLRRGESLLDRLQSEPSAPSDLAECRSFKVGLKLTDLPQGAGLATSSLRRRAQIWAVRPDLRVEEIRGNVETRLKKFEKNSALDGVILAVAGLERLRLQFQNRAVKGASETGKWDGLIAEFIDASVMLPAVGQAAIGLEIRGDDEHTRSLLESVNHFGTFVAVRAERAFLLALGGGCHTPIAALGTFDTAKKIVRLEGAVFSLDGKKQLRGELSGAADDPESLGKKLAEELIAQGAAELLK